ncbi:uncharacterized protein TNCT_346481, partial [Trichonephila clavata]
EKNFAKSSENEEMLKLKQNFILEQEKWQKEKEALTYVESALNENLKSLRESEKKLLGKLKKYEQHTAAVKKHYQEKIANLQSELTEFQKSSNEKQNELQKIKENYEQEILELKSKFRKQNSSRNSAIQTVEEMVPKQTISNLENKFFKCLMNISDGIRHYVTESKNRSAEKLHSALLHYHQQISSKLFQDLSKDIHSFTPTIIIPHNNAGNGTISKETFELSSVPSSLFGTHFKTSTPANFNFVGKPFEPAEKTNMTSNNYSTAPNFNFQTSVKGLFEAKTIDNKSESKTKSQNLYNLSHTTPKLDIFNGREYLLTSKDFFNRGESTVHNTNSNEKVNEHSAKFEDISYDFLSLNLPRDIFDPSKMPGYRLQQGEHENGDKFKDTFPVKLFPS